MKFSIINYVSHTTGHTLKIINDACPRFIWHIYIYVRRQQNEVAAVFSDGDSQVSPLLKVPRMFSHVAVLPKQ